MLNKILSTFDKIGQTSSTKAKGQLLSLLSGTAATETVRDILHYCYNPYITFGITRKEPKNVTCDFDQVEPNAWENFKALLDLLRTRQITGKGAQIAIDGYFQGISPTTALWFNRILNKDLKIGIAESTILNVFPNLFPRYECALCNVFYPDLEMLGDEEWIGEPKIDGYRTQAHIDENGEVTFKSREGNPYYNLDHIADAIKKAGLKNVVIDGECFSKNWNETATIMRTQTPKGDNWQEKCLGITYYAFDILSAGEFVNETGFLPLIERKKALYAVTTAMNSPYVKFVDYIELPKGEEAEQIIIELTDEWCKNGFRDYGIIIEGMVLKQKNAKYHYGKSDIWLKSKQAWEDDFTITGWEFGDPLKGLGETLGALKVTGHITWKGEEYDIAETKVGGGYARKLRDELLPRAQSGELDGKFVQVKFWDIGKNKKDGLWRLRFPVYQRLREDKEY